MPTPELLRTIRDVLAHHDDARLAVLFGSEARGNAGAGSDVDLAVRGGDMLLVASELSEALGREVDIVDLDGRLSVPLLGDLVRDGVIVYDADGSQGGAWLSATLTLLDLDGPQFDRMSRAWIRHLARRVS